MFFPFQETSEGSTYFVLKAQVTEFSEIMLEGDTDKISAYNCEDIFYEAASDGA